LIVVVVVDERERRRQSKHNATGARLKKAQGTARETRARGSHHARVALRLRASRSVHVGRLSARHMLTVVPCVPQAFGLFNSAILIATMAAKFFHLGRWVVN
jgi:hypothetical protein